MNKKTLVLAVLVVLCMSAFAFAQTTESIIDVRAAVPSSSPEFTVLIKGLTSEGQDPWSGTDVTSMDFSTLTHLLADNSEAGGWYSTNYFAVILITNSYGNQYAIRSTSAGLSSGGNALPANSFVLTPGYAEADEFSLGVAQGAQPVGSLLGDAVSAATTDALIYQSETAGSSRIIRAFYSLPAPAATLPFPTYEPIPLSQTSGTYTGTVTITIVPM